MSARAKTNRVGEEHNLTTGVQKHVGNKGTLVVNGTKCSGAEIVATITKRMEATARVVASRDAYSKDVTAEREILASTEPFMADLRQAILVAFGTKSQVLADFGIAAPKKRRALTAEQNLARAAKALATRKLRGTKGPRERLAIKAAGKATVTVTPPQHAGEPNGTTSNGATKTPA
jgi:hypothetical protein